MLQVPAVVIGAHPDKGNSNPYPYGGGSVPKTSKPFLVVPSSPGLITKQRSQPEMSRSYSEGVPTMIKKQPSVFTHTNMPTTSDYPSSSCGQGNHPLLPSVAIQLPLIKKQSSSPGSLLSTSSHLRPIQPKPSSVGGDKEPPIIQFMTDEDQALPPSRFPRAISEEPAMSRNLELLSPGGHIPLTQSVSQDTGLDGGLALMNRIMSSSSQSLGVPKLTTTGGTTSSLMSATSTPSSSSVTHAPVLRDGPALGCNYCWNSQDTQGRVQRRKTKYHCPACRTNLCIVPCFHEYHSQMQMQQDQHKQFTKVLTKTSST